ncbi:MAG: hypothetical protein ACRDSK_31180 [Actinophytocola sp.]|uniref:Rv0361 family membrane protein n=1 Tax=Actinophytocola sp. TaxID=1872138 RepID=UPI003D6B9097
MPWILAGGGVLVIAVAIVLIFMLTGGGSGSPQSLAEDAVAAFNNKDVDKLNELACDEAKEDAPDPKDLEPAEGITVKAELGEVKENGDTATAEITISLSGDLPEGLPEDAGKQTATMTMEDQSGWCIKNLQ